MNYELQTNKQSFNVKKKTKKGNKTKRIGNKTKK
jgi:hypothetical protein